MRTDLCSIALVNLSIDTYLFMWHQRKLLPPIVKLMRRLLQAYHSRMQGRTVNRAAIAEKGSLWVLSNNIIHRHTNRIFRHQRVRLRAYGVIKLFYLICCLGRTEGFTVVARRIETAYMPLSRSELVTSVANPLRTGLGMLG